MCVGFGNKCLIGRRMYCDRLQPAGREITGFFCSVFRSRIQGSSHD